MICVSAGSKSRLAKAAGAEVAAQSRQEKLHAAVARSRFEVTMHKIARVRTTFGSCDVEKWHAAVVRSTFASQNTKKLTVLAHFWKSRCRKMARRCGAKQNLQVKMYKTPQRWTFLKFGSGKIARRCGRSTFPSQNVQNTAYSDHFLKFRCRKMVRRCGAKRVYKSKCK